MKSIILKLSLTVLGVLIFTNCSKDSDVETVPEQQKMKLPDDLCAIDLGLPSAINKVLLC